MLIIRMRRHCTAFLRVLGRVDATISNEQGSMTDGSSTGCGQRLSSTAALQEPRHRWQRSKLADLDRSISYYQRLMNHVVALFLFVGNLPFGGAMRSRMKTAFSIQRPTFFCLRFRDARLASRRLRLMRFAVTWSPNPCNTSSGPNLLVPRSSFPESKPAPSDTVSGCGTHLSKAKTQSLKSMVSE